MIAYSRLLWWNRSSRFSSAGEPAAVAFHVCERFVPVYMRLPFAQQVQVRSVQDINQAAHADTPADRASAKELPRIRSYSSLLTGTALMSPRSFRCVR